MSVDCNDQTSLSSHVPPRFHAAFKTLVNAANALALVCQTREMSGNDTLTDRMRIGRVRLTYRKAITV